jgi:hypothetical protein
MLRLPRRLQAIENVELNATFCRDVLSRINPIFSQVTNIQGRTSLLLEEVEIPLGKQLKTGGKGRGRLICRDVVVRPDGMLAKLLSLLNFGRETCAMRVSGADFIIREGGVDYDNFRVDFGESLDLIFSGRVRFDDSMEMQVSVPIRVGLLRRMGVQGPVVDYARYLKDVRIKIPVAGSRKAPRLDFSRVDAKPLVEEAVKRMAAKSADGFLRSLLKPKQE